MERLSALVNDRLQELLLYRAFVAHKGLQEEFDHLLETAKAVSEKARGGKVETPIQLLQSKQ